MRRLLLLFLLLAPPSCATKKDPPRNPRASTVATPPKPSIFQTILGKIPNPFPRKQKPPTAVPPQWIGVIRMVNSAENFVLVESGAISSAIPGETYLAVGKGVETATLRMTSLKNPPFLIADIVSGSPSQGDKIYLPKTTSPNPAPTPKPTSAPKPSPSPNAKTSPPSSNPRSESNGM
ncbi:MAG: hypothetical protein WC003_03915 [Terrimicrobiaceae bacterium]